MQHVVETYGSELVEKFGFRVLEYPPQWSHTASEAAAVLKSIKETE